jgi:DNA-binding MarR family transcriptional regulator
MRHKKNRLINQLHEKFDNLVQLYLEIEKTPRKYGTGELLTSVEIHLIELIGDNHEQLSVTELATASGVTKGAISQNLKKLEKKGLSGKDEDPANASRAIVQLTSKGKAAYFAHKHWHETMDGGYLQYIEELGEEKIAFVLEFLVRVERLLESIIAEGD